MAGEGTAPDEAGRQGDGGDRGGGDDRIIDRGRVGHGNDDHGRVGPGGGDRGGDDPDAGDHGGGDHGGGDPGAGDDGAGDHAGDVRGGGDHGGGDHGGGDHGGGDHGDGDGDGDPGDDGDDGARHAEKMRRRKAVRDRMMAERTLEKGLLVVHTGTGKGKSTAAFGMAMRCIGHGLPVGIVQFIKGRLATGETEVFARFPDLVTLKRMGEGFTWETQDRARDIAAARAAWDAGREMIASGAFRMVVLDELNIALRYDYLPLAEVLEAFSARPAGVHVVVTGRNAKPELIAAADLVTEMTMIKHPFRSGVKPQAGIEF